MTLIEKIIARAQSNRQRIVLPESLEERTLTAADRAVADKLAEIILIGNREEILARAKELNLTQPSSTPRPVRKPTSTPLCSTNCVRQKV